MSKRKPMRPGTARNRPGLVGCERCSRSFGGVQALLQHLHDKHGEGQVDGEDRPSKDDRPPPVCPYCGQDAELWNDSRIVYAEDYGPIWLCEPCGAWVGCHEGTVRPLGRLADKELRLAKQRAHAAFDPLWREKWRRLGGRVGRAKGLAYAWLADELGLEPSACHIGEMDIFMWRAGRRGLRALPASHGAGPEEAWRDDVSDTYCLVSIGGNVPFEVASELIEDLAADCFGVENYATPSGMDEMWEHFREAERAGNPVHLYSAGSEHGFDDDWIMRLAEEHGFAVCIAEDAVEDCNAMLTIWKPGNIVKQTWQHSEGLTYLPRDDIARLMESGGLAAALADMEEAEHFPFPLVIGPAPATSEGEAA